MFGCVRVWKHRQHREIIPGPSVIYIQCQDDYDYHRIASGEDYIFRIVLHDAAIRSKWPNRLYPTLYKKCSNEKNIYMKHWYIIINVHSVNVNINARFGWSVSSRWQVTHVPTYTQCTHTNTHKAVYGLNCQRNVIISSERLQCRRIRSAPST